MTNAGIVDEAVKAAVTGDGLGDCRVNLLSLRDIGGKIDGLAALLRDHVDGRRASFDDLLRHIRNHDTRALGRKQPRDGAADAGRGAGHDPHLIGEPEAAHDGTSDTFSAALETGPDAGPA